MGSMTESPSQPIEFPNASARAGFMVGLDLCTQVLWKFALRIKDDQTRGFSERKAIVEVLNEIHKEFVAEMEKANGNANKSPRINGDSQERQQASK